MKNNPAMFLFSYLSVAGRGLYPRSKRLKFPSILIFSIFLYFLFSFSPTFAESDASLYLSPSTGAYSIGELFAVGVNINTNGKTINTAEGTISFNKDELEVMSISKEGSILTSWPSEPEFSNREGMVSFGGSTRKDGYTGNNGKILSIVFKALQSKASTVKFSMGAAIAATDGLGTNILTSMNAGKYELSPREVIPLLAEAEFSAPENMVTPSIASSTPFVITSSTHPDQTAWYATTTAMLSWVLPDEAISTSFSFDQKPTSTPKSVYPPSVVKKIIKNISEGVSYFHFQKNVSDEWSDTLHYRIAVDVTPPEHFSISQSFADKYGFTFGATDAVSGIEKYMVRIDGGSPTEWKDDGSHVYVPQGLTSGDHTLYVKALDFAGNFKEQTSPFTVLAVPSPTLAKIPEADISIGSPLKISWKFDLSGQVRVFVAKDGGEAHVYDSVKGADGVFTFTMKDPVEEGKYSLYAISIVKGIESKPTETIAITGSSGIVVFGKKILNLFSGISLVDIFVILCVIIACYGWYRFSGHSRELSKEATSTKEPFASSLSSLGDKKHIPVTGGTAEEEKTFQVRIQKKT